MEKDSKFSDAYQAWKHADLTSWFIMFGYNVNDHLPEDDESVFVCIKLSDGRLENDYAVYENDRWYPSHIKGTVIYWAVDQRSKYNV